MQGYRQIEDAELLQVLPLLLVAGVRERLPGPDAATGYQRHLAATAQRWLGWVAGPLDAPQAVCLAILPPDDTALMMIAPPGAFGTDAAIQSAVTQAAMEVLDRRGVVYAQALLDPRDDARRRLLERVGFRRVTELVYLERASADPDRAAPSSACEWRAYTPDAEAVFAQVVRASYEGSQDCPELAGLRPMSAVLAAHRAAGPFDPDMWQLALVNGQPAGCIMTSRVTDTRCVEIVYLGVAPAFRRRGVGRALVQRGIGLAASDGAATLLVAVDERNLAARRLYARFGFRPLLRRCALLRR
jgi:ribosomal protein S18 acetylase RimI-like enzyme